MVINADGKAIPTRSLATAPKKATTISEKTSAAIAAMTTYFNVNPGHQVSIPTNISLYSITQTCYTITHRTFALPEDPSSEPLSDLTSPSHVIDAIFDTDAKLFFQDAPLLAYLTPDLKSSLLAQAITGLVIFFRRLSDALSYEELPFITPYLFAKELESFRHSEERIAALAAVEASDLFAGCRGRGQIATLVSRVVERADDESELSDMIEDAHVHEDSVGMLGWAVERPRNMGLPWGFSILPVN
ncbi:hypothetical protein SAPIO_CDS10194 [Scedosporium apiospermum]|uniref:Uncharacterized protein n=1 Tax=Pseudallescheria apiosperma TaxID=563466 RepID=A0A084FUX0_PSEDA|nr:uncharacterized protein SAPIO_CDS10194 [Scedosporium apiospermum]KEZ38882.1 hypothetical protein SAPIO_CDS10194 [Scedosporium apiospermum]